MPLARRTAIFDYRSEKNIIPLRHVKNWPTTGNIFSREKVYLYAAGGHSVRHILPNLFALLAGLKDGDTHQRMVICNQARDLGRSSLTKFESYVGT